MKACKKSWLLVMVCCGPSMCWGEPSAPLECLVFHTEHKSAGYTVESAINSEIRKSCQGKCDVSEFDWEEQRCPRLSLRRCSSAPRVLYANSVSAYSQDPSWSRPRCNWFTLIRDPIARLASALFYCRQAPTDPLCGARALGSAADAKRIFSEFTMRDMADHWGNLLLREMLFFRGNFEKAQANAAFAKATAACPKWLVEEKTDDEAEKFPPWLLWRRALRNQGCADEPTTQSGARNLNLAIKHLSENYDALGILEHFPDTMRLFDCLVPLYSSNANEWKHWEPTLRKHRQTHGSNKYKRDELDAIVAAKTDPYILSRLAGDIAVYNASVALFNKNLNDLQQGNLHCLNSDLFPQETTRRF